MSKWFTVIIMLLSLMTSACVSIKRGNWVRDKYTSIEHDYKSIPNDLKISYIGCGGFMISYHNEGILLDPYFSNLGMTKICSKKAFTTNTAIVDSFLKKHLGHETDIEGRIQTILIAHAHYDHLGDVPYLIRKRLQADKLKILGSESVYNLLKSYQFSLKESQYAPIEAFYSNFYQSTEKHKATDGLMHYFQYWAANKSVRITAIPSEHAGHFCFFGPQKVPFISGSVRHIISNPPQKGCDFKEGENFNFMLDFYDSTGQKIIYRIFSNAGAGCNERVGYPPETLLNEKKVDLLLVCGASYSLVNNYPCGLINYTKPDAVFINHWENFFCPIPSLLKQSQVVPQTNIPKLLNEIERIKKETGYPQHIWVTQPLSDLFK